jgi:uracil-DNA glycosylase
MPEDASVSRVNDSNLESAGNLLTPAFATLVRDVQNCTVCSEMNQVHVLSERNGAVPAPIMFIGEAVGRLGGARTGVPMSIDATGKRFNILLAEAGIRRDAVFISNAVLCNPLKEGNNRRPRRSEIAACSSFLSRQIEVVSPDFVVTLGEVALSALSQIRPHTYTLKEFVGKFLEWNGRILVPLYHPGPRAVLHRPHPEQVGDWRQLGAAVLARHPRLAEMANC